MGENIQPEMVPLYCESRLKEHSTMRWIGQAFKVCAAQEKARNAESKMAEAFDEEGLLEDEENEDTDDSENEESEDSDDSESEEESEEDGDDDELDSDEEVDKEIAALNEAKDARRRAQGGKKGSKVKLKKQQKKEKADRDLKRQER